MKKSGRTKGSIVGATAAAAAAVGIGLGAGSANANPSDPYTPTLPSSPFQGHTRAPDVLFNKLPDVFVPGDPYRVVTRNFDRFNQRFGGIAVGPDAATNGDAPTASEGASG